MKTDLDQHGSAAPSSRTRTITWPDPREQFRVARSMTGLELIRKMVTGDLARPPIMELIDFRFTRAEHGAVTIECTPQEMHFNPIGVVHGGIHCTLLDSAMSCAVYCSLPLGMAFTTLQVNVHFIRSIVLESGLLRCDGKVVHSGSRTATAEARLVDSQGKLYAHASTTCLIYSVESK
jgi:uncharacterized protein (TIGR00369 family)